MDAIPLFLNDASYPSVSNDEHEVQEQVLQLLRTLKRVKSLDRPFVIGAVCPMSDIPLTSAYRTLATLAAVDKEWWRFIRALDQRVPFGEVPQCVPPQDGVHVVVGGFSPAAPLWVLSNNAFMVSLPSRGELLGHLVGVAVCACADGAHVLNQRNCRNISIPAHVDEWRDALLDFDYVESASSTVFECVDYQLKMYLHDHEPPHVHVYQAGNARRCVGRVRFDHVEVMEDEGFSGGVKKDVLALLHGRQAQFLRAWERCREGNLPNRVGLLE